MLNCLSLYVEAQTMVLICTIGCIIKFEQLSLEFTDLKLNPQIHVLAWEVGENLGR